MIGSFTGTNGTEGTTINDVVDVGLEGCDGTARSVLVPGDAAGTNEAVGTYRGEGFGANELAVFVDLYANTAKMVIPAAAASTRRPVRTGRK